MNIHSLIYKDVIAYLIKIKIKIFLFFILQYISNNKVINKHQIINDKI